MRIRDQLYGGDPFASLDVCMIEPDLSGWGSTHPVFEILMRKLRPARIFEVGTWKGGSAIHMATLMRALGVDGEIVCIDTWLGAPIAWTSEPDLKNSLRLRGGYPQLYYTFARNVSDAGVDDIITPLPAASDGAFRILDYYGARADLIYIDGDHDYAPCKRDFENFFQLLNQDGVLIGDDFGCFPGVTRAAQEVAERYDLYAIKQREKIVMSRQDIGSTLGLVSDGYYERHALGQLPQNADS